MGMFQFLVILKVIRVSSASIYRLIFMSSSRDFDAETVREYLLLNISFLSASELELETFSPTKRENIISRYGDLRIEASSLILYVWDGIGFDQMRFIREFLQGFLRLALSNCQTLRDAGRKLFLGSVLREYTETGALKNVEHRTIDAVDLIVREGKKDELFREHFMPALAKEIKDMHEVSEAGTAFVSDVSQLYDLLSTLQNIDKDSKFEDERVSATLKVMQYLKQTGRLDMFSRYVHYLSEFHGELGNFVEAAIVLLSHAELCSWSVEDQCEPLGSLFPRQSHFERKEEIVLSAIDLFHHGRYWERAIDLIHQLKEQYESSIYDYRKLSVILRREADMRESIIDRDRFFSTYFRVAFYGRGFSAEYMNKEFVYKGAELERVAEFVGRIMSKFPNCEKMNASDVPSDDIINGSGRYIQIHTCLPVPSPAVMAHDERPLRIQKYYEHDRVETFMYAKTFRKGEKSGNEFRDLWVCNTYVTVETPFPHVYRRNLVISRREEFISPIQNAINMIVSKNSELTLLVEKHSNGMTENVNPFTMTLNGIIDAAVNGGVYNYRDAFFTPKYLAMFPQDEEKLAELRKALSDQEEILEDALSVHKKVCGDGLLALHHKLEQFFAKMKKDLQPMLREVTFKNPLYANEVPEISIWFSRIYGGENM